MFNLKKGEKMKTKWSKETLNKVRKIAKENSINKEYFSDDDLKEFLNLFSKAMDKVKKERA